MRAGPLALPSPLLYSFHLFLSLSHLYIVSKAAKTVKTPHPATENPLTFRRIRSCGPSGVGRRPPPCSGTTLRWWTRCPDGSGGSRRATGVPRHREAIIHNAHSSDQVNSDHNQSSRVQLDKKVQHYHLSITSVSRFCSKFFLTILEAAADWQILQLPTMRYAG